MKTSTNPFSSALRFFAFGAIALSLTGCVNQGCTDEKGQNFCVPAAGAEGASSPSGTGANTNPHATLGTLEEEGTDDGATDDSNTDGGQSDEGNCDGGEEEATQNPDGEWPAMTDEEYNQARHFRRAEPNVHMGYEGRSWIFESTIRVDARRIHGDGWELYGVTTADDGTPIAEEQAWVWPVRESVFAAMALESGEPKLFRIFVEFDTHQGSAILAVRHSSEHFGDN